MSSFSQTEQLISDLPQSIELFQTKLQKLQPTNQTPFQQLESLYNEAIKLNREIENSKIILSKSVKRAEEKDPNRIIYGPNMIKRVKIANEKFFPLYEKFHPMFKQFHCLCTQALETQRKAIEEFERRKQQELEEVERRRIQKLKEDEENERKQKEESERQRCEKIEKQKQIDAELKAEALRKKNALIEQRKEELRAHKRAEQQKKAKIEEERKAKIAEKAAKKEKLQAAQTAAKSKIEQSKSSEQKTSLSKYLDTLQTSLNDNTKYGRALEQILRKVEAIMNNPHNSALLKIDLSADIEFSQSVTSHKGGREICNEIGFLPQGDNLESTNIFQMAVSAAQWEKLVSAKETLQKQIITIKQNGSNQLNHTAPHVTTTDTATVDDVDMLDEEAMLQQAIAMSMMENQPNSNNNNNNNSNSDKKENK